MHFLVVRLVLFWLFCATAMSVASDGVLFPPSPLCSPVSEMEAVAYLCEVSTAIYKVQRIATQSIQDTKKSRYAWIFPAIQYLYPISMIVVVSLCSLLFED